MIDHPCRRIRAATFLAAFCGATAAAAEPDGPVATTARDARPEARVTPPANDLQVRYAEARLRLAELDLEQAISVNEQAHGAIGDREMHRLRTHVAMLKRQVEIAREHPRTAARHASIAAAEAACADARGDLDAALRANQRTPGAVSDINVARLRAKVDVAEIRTALCASPEYELSLLAELEWNIEQLTDEVIDLRHRMETGSSRDSGHAR